ncbi:MAG: hypothetical protein HDS75_04280 [Bacteroidales bacterium]|nr:hypothetical protein [Bacteroidales bacterium]
MPEPLTVGRAAVWLSRFCFKYYETADDVSPKVMNKMKVYFIYGDKDVGKTTVCQKIRGFLLKHAIPEISFSTFKWENDFRSIFINDEKLIGVYSVGDGSRYLREALRFGHENKCDILIAAVSTGIKYNRPINEELIPEKDSIEWLTLSSCESDDERDRLEDKLVDQILKLLF